MIIHWLSWKYLLKVTPHWISLWIFGIVRWGNDAVKIVESVQVRLWLLIALTSWSIGWLNGSLRMIHWLSQALNCTRSFALSCKYVAKENKYSTVEYCTITVFCYIDVHDLFHILYILYYKLIYTSIWRMMDAFFQCSFLNKKKRINWSLYSRYWIMDWRKIECILFSWYSEILTSWLMDFMNNLGFSPEHGKNKDGMTLFAWWRRGYPGRPARGPSSEWRGQAGRPPGVAGGQPPATALV